MRRECGPKATPRSFAVMLHGDMKLHGVAEYPAFVRGIIA